MGIFKLYFLYICIIFENIVIWVYVRELIVIDGVLVIYVCLFNICYIYIIRYKQNSVNYNSINMIIVNNNVVSYIK